jgi:hypothetical protein
MRAARCICAMGGSYEGGVHAGKLSGGNFVYSYLRAQRRWIAEAAGRTVTIAPNAVQASGTNVRSRRFCW